MDENLRTALERILPAAAVLGRTQPPPSFDAVIGAKLDLEAAVGALETWLDERVMDEPAIYHPDCPACLRGLAHTQREHDTEIDRVHAASRG